MKVKEYIAVTDISVRFSIYDGEYHYRVYDDDYLSIYKDREIDTVIIDDDGVTIFLKGE